MSHSANRSSEAVLALVREVEEEAAGGAEALFMAAMLAPSALPYDFALSVEGAEHNPSLVNPAAAFFAATATMEPLVYQGAGGRGRRRPDVPGAQGRAPDAA